MAICLCYGSTYIRHGEVALTSVLVDPVEAAVVLPELPTRPPPLLLFVPPLPLPLPPLRRLLLLLGGRDSVKNYDLGAEGTMLV
jgi:hypothetical protein